MKPRSGLCNRPFQKFQRAACGGRKALWEAGAPACRLLAEALARLVCSVRACGRTNASLQGYRSR